MKPEDYYRDTLSRSADWVDQAAEPGFAPVRITIETARPHLSTGGRVLDIGCQGGHQLALLADDFDELVGLDIAPYDEMWRLLPQAEFLVHDVDSAPLPFPANHFRSVVCTNLLEHVFDVFGVVREIERVLAPGGTLLLSVPNVSAWRHILALLAGRVPRTGALSYPFDDVQGWDGQHLHYFTHTEVKWLLGQFGLSVVSTSVYGRFPQLKRVAPRFLAGTVDVVARKPA